MNQRNQNQISLTQYKAMVRNWLLDKGFEWSEANAMISESAGVNAIEVSYANDYPPETPAENIATGQPILDNTSEDYVVAVAECLESIGYTRPVISEFVQTTYKGFIAAHAKVQSPDDTADDIAEMDQEVTLDEDLLTPERQQELLQQELLDLNKIRDIARKVAMQNPGNPLKQKKLAEADARYAQTIHIAEMLNITLSTNLNKAATPDKQKENE